MLAEQLIQDGDLAAALKALQDTVRQQPSSAKHRVFLFQLLCVMGDWQRALTQLNVAAELDASTLPMAQTYREAIQCEALRAEIFAGRRDPVIFGEPQPWMAQLAEALKRDVDDAAGAASLRAQAFESAPASSGSIDGRRFDWLADADGRLGPILETIVNGRYVWIPFMRIARIEIDAPTDLRDTVWTAAAFTWTNGAQGVGLIPSRYPGSTQADDDAIKLARRTEWIGDRALGQRMLASDADDHALMDVRLIEFDGGADADDRDDGGHG